MDKYDFKKIDREVLAQIVEEANRDYYHWVVSQMEAITPPEPFILIPIGEYDGGELLPGAVVLDDSYIVYLEIENLEYNCEVIIN